MLTPKTPGPNRPIARWEWSPVATTSTKSFGPSASDAVNDSSLQSALAPERRFAMSTTTVEVKFTPEQYLALERRAVTKSEYLDGEIHPMSGASRAHNLIAKNLVGELH